ncbi:MULTISPECIES: flagellin [unclassified Thermotoga]|uniref:flagellin n=1 Tax=unclassified Thermotoga TaxID=2631113 RepID=UPI0005438FD7|nr:MULTISPECIES: flagellin [unclassified Thermotoga]KHC91204.1 flagellin domain protein [Thermotoga sp. TBGT1765]KHC92117.1 flagellin domain protein [Thermotoga sp. TBGT1766]
MRVNDVSLMRYIQQLSLERKAPTPGSFLFNTVSELTIQQKLRGQIEGYRTTLSQIYNGIGLLNTADSGLESISTSLQRARELAVQASNATLTDVERSMIQKEYEEIMRGVKRIIQQTTYNEQRVLAGDVRNLVIQTGPNEGQNVTVNIPNLEETLSELFEVDLSTFEGAQRSLETIDQALENISQIRGNVGSWMNRLESSARSVMNSYTELFKTESLFEPNVAELLLESTKEDILRQTALTGILFRMENAGNVLKLLM